MIDIDKQVTDTSRFYQKATFIEERYCSLVMFGREQFHTADEPAIGSFEMIQ